MASAFVWAELHLSARNPRAEHASNLARRVADDLERVGWRLERVLTDNASEFRSGAFAETVAQLGAVRSFITAGRPQSNGCIQRVQQTILEECSEAGLRPPLIPKYTGLRRGLLRHLTYYSFERAHTGRWTRGRTPGEVLGKAKCYG